MAEEREKLREVENQYLEESGKGLHRSQVEIRYAPWQLTWVRQDMMMERQERIIELLEEILKAMKKK